MSKIRTWARGLFPRSANRSDEGGEADGGTKELIDRTRGLLEKALDYERKNPIPANPIWDKSRREMREYIFKEDFTNFLKHDVCCEMFFRIGWGAPQDFESAAISGTSWGRRRIKNFVEPKAGKPQMSPKIRHMSTNMLGMLYYLHQLKNMYKGKFPGSVVEFGGGYGAFAWLYMKEKKDAAYAMMDLPELAALQYFYLSRALPETNIRFSLSPGLEMKKSEIAIIPISLIDGLNLNADLFFSTFAFSEIPHNLQNTIERKKYFNAKKIFLCGQLDDEKPGLGLVPHHQVVGQIMKQFANVKVERFHIRNNYLVEAENPIPSAEINPKEREA